MRREALYLSDIVEAAEAIARYIRSHDEASFLADDQAQSAVAFQLSIIGEAVTNLPDDLKERHPEVAWRLARRLRNVLTHHYFAVQWPVIWETASADMPTFRQQIMSIAAAEFPNDESPR